MDVFCYLLQRRGLPTKSSNKMTPSQDEGGDFPLSLGRTIPSFRIGLAMEKKNGSPSAMPLIRKIE